MLVDWERWGKRSGTRLGEGKRNMAVEGGGTSLAGGF